MALSKVNPNFVEQTPYGRRNLIINGAMQVAQRGTSISGVATAYLIDRFQCASNAADWAMDRSTDVPSNEQFTYSIKISPTSIKTPSSGTYAVLGQGIEGQNMAHLKWGTSNAQPIVITFWVKSSKTGIYTYCIKNSAANRSYITEYTINTADTWEKKTIYVNGDTSGSWPADNSRGMTNDFWLAGENVNSSNLDSWRPNNQNMSSNQVNFFDNTSNEFYFTGLQVEVGDIATPFEHRSYGEDLVICKRYFQQSGAGSPAKANSTTEFWVGVTFSTQMRANPALSFNYPNNTVRIFEFGIGNRDSDSTPNLSSAYYNPTGCLLRMGNFSGISAGDTGITGGSSDGAVGGESALTFNFDAEL